MAFAGELTRAKRKRNAGLQEFDADEEYQPKRRKTGTRADHLQYKPRARGTLGNGDLALVDVGRYRGYAAAWIEQSDTRSATNTEEFDDEESMDQDDIETVLISNLLSLKSSGSAIPPPSPPRSPAALTVIASHIPLTVNPVAATSNNAVSTKAKRNRKRANPLSASAPAIGRPGLTTSGGLPKPLNGHTVKPNRSNVEFFLQRPTQQPHKPQPCDATFKDFVFSRRRNPRKPLAVKCAPQVLAPAQARIPSPNPRPRDALSTFENMKLGLQVVKHAPAKALYRRTLKPCPVVFLTNLDNSSATTTASGPKNLIIEASLVKQFMGANGLVEVALPDDSLDGVKIAAISTGAFVTFKKLKIMCTSQQEGAHFRLKFRLKGFLSSGATLHDSVPLSFVAYSNPIEVFSHSQYLNNKNAGVVEVLPETGPIEGGTRVVILGYNFRPGALTCTTPPSASKSGNTCLVDVIDKESGFCSHSPAKFVYA